MALFLVTPVNYVTSANADYHSKRKKHQRWRRNDLQLFHFIYLLLNVGNDIRMHNAVAHLRQLITWKSIKDALL